MADGDRLLDLGGVVVAALLVLMIVALALAFVAGPRDRADEAPGAEWSLERANDTHVRLVHAGGEPVRADRLVVTVDGTRRRATWSGLVGPGDAGAVNARDGLLVRLYWTTERGDRVLLSTWRT